MVAVPVLRITVPAEAITGGRRAAEAAAGAAVAAALVTKAVVPVLGEDLDSAHFIKVKVASAHLHLHQGFVVHHA